MRWEGWRGILCCGRSSLKTACWSVLFLGTQDMSSSLGHYGLLPTRLLYPWGSPGKNTGVGCHAMPSSKCSSQRRDQIRSSTLQADSLPSKPPGKPQNTAVGSLFLLQDIFPAQELSQGLLCWATREPHTHIYQQSSMAHDWIDSSTAAWSSSKHQLSR